MTNSRALNKEIATKVGMIFENIGGEKYVNDLFKSFDIDGNVKFRFYKKLPVPFHVRPLGKNSYTKFAVAGSKSDLISLYISLYENMKHRDIDIEPTADNVKALLKIVLAHEIGHVLDDKLQVTSEKEKDIAKTYGSYIGNIKVNFDFESMKLNIIPDMHNENTEASVYDMKKTLIYRETNAWIIARNIMNFDNDKEKHMFNILREYALATYNQIDASFVARYYLAVLSIKERLEKICIA